MGSQAEKLNPVEELINHKNMKKLVKESLFEDIKDDFKVGDLVRWSHPRNQTGLPTLYGMLTAVKKNTVSIVFLGTGGHNEYQPSSRNDTWLGGKHVPWEGDFTKEELETIAQDLLKYKSAGEGYDKKHLSFWDPEE